MSERRQHITDDGALHKYRTEVPNTIIRGVLGRGLSLPARWLYVYLKSVAGDDGECWQNMTTLAAGSQLSRGAVSNARHELCDARLIAVIKGKGALHQTDHIRILDIWRQNMTEFCMIPSSSDERAPSSLSESEDAKESQEVASSLPHRVHQVNASSSSGERASSLHERPSSSGELKKIPLKKIPEKKVETPPPISPIGEGDGGWEEMSDPVAASYRTPPKNWKELGNQVRAHLMKVTGRQYQSLGNITACVTAGATVGEMCLVIDWWQEVFIVEHPNQATHFNTRTPFSTDKFDDYRAAAVQWNEQGRPPPMAQHTASNGRRYTNPSPDQATVEAMAKALEEKEAPHGDQ